MKKLIARGLMFVLVLTMFSTCQIQAASKKTGTYYKTYKIEDKTATAPTYGITINKIKNNKITFQIAYHGKNGSPVYLTDVITAKIKKNRVSFQWVDSWGNEGTGKMKLCSGYVKLKMTQTKDSGTNRYTLGTANKYIKLPKKSNKTKVTPFGQ